MRGSNNCSLRHFFLLQVVLKIGMGGVVRRSLVVLLNVGVRSGEQLLVAVQFDAQ